MFFTFMTFLIFGSNISCVKLLVDPFREDFQKLIFDNPYRDDFGEPTSIACGNVYVYRCIRRVWSSHNRCNWDVHYCCPFGSWLSCLFCYRTLDSWFCCFYSWCCYLCVTQCYFCVPRYIFRWVYHICYQIT